MGGKRLSHLPRSDSPYRRGKSADSGSKFSRQDQISEPVLVQKGAGYVDMLPNVSGGTFMDTGGHRGSARLVDRRLALAGLLSRAIVSAGSDSIHGSGPLVLVATIVWPEAPWPKACQRCDSDCAHPSGAREKEGPDVAEGSGGTALM